MEARGVAWGETEFFLDMQIRIFDRRVVITDLTVLTTGSKTLVEHFALMVHKY